MSDSRYASRKFLLASAGWLAGVVFFALGKLDASQWMSQSAWVLGLYLAANVSDQVASRDANASLALKR